MITRRKWQFNLDSNGIDACVETIQGITREYLKEVPQIGTIAFSMELVLLNFQKHFGDGHTFELEFVDRFGRVNLYIKLKGESFDPRVISQAEDEFDEFSSIILNKYSEDATEFKYDRGVNIVHRIVKKKARIGSGTKILIGLVLGILLGMIGQLFPAQTQESLVMVLNTINGIVLDLIVMGATLVVFMMVINSISGFGSLSTVRKTGSNIIKRYLITYFMAILISILYILIVFTFSLENESDSANSILSIFLETIAGIFPQSAVSPFVDCNFLQIIFLAVMMGIAMLVIGDKAKPVRDFCDSFEAIADQILDWFCALLPLFVFSMIPSLIWQGQLAEMALALVQLLGITLASVILFAIRLAVMCGKLKTGPVKALRILKPAMLQGLVTGSSNASLSQIHNAIKGLKVKDSFNSFAIAMGIIFEVSSAYIGYMVLSFYVLLISGTPISVSTIVSIIIVCLLLSIAAPPVSGGAIAIELIILEMFNVPDTYLAIVPPFMLVFDFIATGLRCGGMVVTAASAAHSLNELDS